MGNQEQEHLPFLQRFQVLQGQGQARLLQQKFSGRQFVLRELVEDDSQWVQERLTKLRALNGENIVHLVQTHVVRTKGLCASNKKLYLLMDQPHRTLLDEISTREPNSNSKRFKQTDLWSVLVSVSKGMAELQKQGIIHRSLNASTVFVSNEGVMKVADPWLTDTLGKENDVDKKRQQQKRIKSYHKTDVRDLGYLLLKLAVNCHSQEESEIQASINLFRREYSPELMSYLDLFMGQEDARPDWFQVLHKISEDECKLSQKTIKKEQKLDQARLQKVRKYLDKVAPRSQSMSSRQSEKLEQSSKHFAFVAPGLVTQESNGQKQYSRIREQNQSRLLLQQKQRKKERTQSLDKRKVKQDSGKRTSRQTSEKKQQRQSKRDSQKKLNQSSRNRNKVQTSQQLLSKQQLLENYSGDSAKYHYRPAGKQSLQSKKASRLVQAVFNTKQGMMQGIINGIQPVPAKQFHSPRTSKSHVPLQSRIRLLASPDPHSQTPNQIFHSQLQAQSQKQQKQRIEPQPHPLHHQPEFYKISHREQFIKLVQDAPPPQSQFARTRIHKQETKLKMANQMGLAQKQQLEVHPTPISIPCQLIYQLPNDRIQIASLPENRQLSQATKIQPKHCQTQSRPGKQSRQQLYSQQKLKHFNFKPLEWTDEFQSQMQYSKSSRDSRPFSIEDLRTENKGAILVQNMGRDIRTNLYYNEVNRQAQHLISNWVVPQIVHQPPRPPTTERAVVFQRPFQNMPNPPAVVSHGPPPITRSIGLIGIVPIRSNSAARI